MRDKLNKSMSYAGHHASDHDLFIRGNTKKKDGAFMDFHCISWERVTSNKEDIEDTLTVVIRVNFISKRSTERVQQFRDWVGTRIALTSQWEVPVTGRLDTVRVEKKQIKLELSGLRNVKD